MIRKLLKYDMRYTFRIMSFVLLVSLATSLLFSLSLFIGSKFASASVFSMILIFPYLITVVILSVSCFAVTAVRIYKNFYSDEGYLTFTLPVTSTQLMISKIITYIFWRLVTSLAIIACIGIPILTATYSFATEELTEFVKLVLDYLMFMVRSYVTITEDGLIFFIIVNILSFIVTYISVPMLIMFSFSVGQLANKYRLLVAFIVYYVYNMLSTSLISAVDAFTSGNTNLIVPEGAVRFDIINISQSTLSSTVINAVLAVALFFITRHIMSKKLNLI